MAKMAAKNDPLHSSVTELIEAGRCFHSRGWVPATSGNFSARLPDGSIAITTSGKDKGRLKPSDFMRIDDRGHPLSPGKPSAETLLHTGLYNHFPDIGCVLHLHSANAVLLSRLWGHKLVLKDFEILKAFEGISTHRTRVVIPIFPNDQDISRLSNKVNAHMARHPPIYGYIIAGHGYYTWGREIKDARRHVEALEFLFEVEVRLKGVSHEPANRVF